MDVDLSAEGSHLVKVRYNHNCYARMRILSRPGLLIFRLPSFTSRYISITSQNGKAVYSAVPLGAKELISVHLTHHDLKRLELYARNMVDHHMIGDILPTLARLLFLGRLRG